MAYSVLIVDDSETIRESLIRTMEMAQLPLEEVFHASNGNEALEKLDSEWVDIVFSDINMPGMNGIELLEKMKSDAVMQDIPVVIISTEGSKERIREMDDKGSSGYLRKPFKPEKVKDTIINIIGEWENG